MPLALIILLLLALVLLAGWLVPLIVGIARRRAGKSATALLVTGIVWGILSLCAAGVGITAFRVARSFQSVFEVEEFDAAANGFGFVQLIELP